MGVDPKSHRGSYPRGPPRESLEDPRSYVSDFFCINGKVIIDKGKNEIEKKTKRESGRD